MSESATTPTTIRQIQLLNGDTVQIYSPAADTTPTSGSSNLVTSGGVYTYVEQAASRAFFSYVGFSIAVTDWTGNGPYTYTKTHASFGENTALDVFIDYEGCGDALPMQSWRRVGNNGGPDFHWTRVSGGMQFTTSQLPSGTISGTIRVLGTSTDHRLVAFSANEVPITRGGTGASDAAGARVNLGLGAVENKSSATIRNELTQANVNSALGTGIGTARYYREDGTWATPPDTTYGVATTSASGLMSSTDKVKLDGIDMSGKKNVQSAVSDPTASGTGITFIDSITQNAQGVITPTKKTVKTMVGATGNWSYQLWTAGEAGLVPAPAVGDHFKCLRGDGTWGVPNVPAKNDSIGTVYLSDALDNQTRASSGAGIAASTYAVYLLDQNKVAKGCTWGELQGVAASAE